MFTFTVRNALCLKKEGSLMRLPPCHRIRHRALLALAVLLLPEGVPIIRGSASAPPRSGASACLTIGAAGIDRPATHLCWAMGLSARSGPMRELAVS